MTALRLLMMHGCAPLHERFWQHGLHAVSTYSVTNTVLQWQHDATLTFVTRLTGKVLACYAACNLLYLSDKVQETLRLLAVRKGKILIQQTALQPVEQMNVGVQAQKPVLVTAPYGRLDPLMDHAHLPLFPIPSGLLQEAAQLHTDAQRHDLDATQYGQSFCSDAFRGNAAAILAAAQK